MIIRPSRFNIYFFALATLLIAGCHSAPPEPKEKKIVTTLRIHAEMSPDPNGRSERVEVFRARPYWVTIDKEPFLSEAFIKDAKVIDTMGGYALQLQFDRQGTWLLEEYTAALRGKHVAIFSQFADPGDDKINKGRWLAAPLIRSHVKDGLFVFTPDASREEAEHIALGLKHVASKIGSE